MCVGIYLAYWSKAQMNATLLELLGTENEDPMLLRNAGNCLPVQRA